MLTSSEILSDFLEERIRFPKVGKERDWHSWSKKVNLEASDSYGIHDWSIVDGFYLDSSASGSEEKVGVSSGAERVSDYQKRVNRFMVLVLADLI